MEKNFNMSPNPLVKYLKKEARDFTRNDIIDYIENNEIEMLNFRYVANDGRLKTLNFIIQDREHLETMLISGERVDGSSLFNHIQAGSSDLYVIPRYRTAFLNPFCEIPSLDILCSFYNQLGEPLESSPQYMLRKAHKALKDSTGLEFHVMGELEYYSISEMDNLFQTENQKGYHESYPFNKNEVFRKDAIALIAQCGGNIKYAHSEVGNFIINDLEYEQNEIEFRPVNVEEAADQLVVAKWIIRTLAYEYDINVTFAPKISVGKAGSGLHIHTKLIKDGKNVMVENGVISDIAKRAIAGYLDLAPSLSAFGNTNPTSYFRLVPHQEAPTNVCWGDRNRSVLVRVPLGWRSSKDMSQHANPLEKPCSKDYSSKQTVEFRCPDGSADIYLLLAGLAVAARHGLEMDNALEMAEKTYVGVNIFDDENQHITDTLKQLPTSCYESATMLEEQATIYKKYDVFNQDIIDGIVEDLKAYNDSNIRRELNDDETKIMDLVQKFIHCG